MAEQPEPVVLELAPLPREQIGPFILLGIEKDATAEDIEAHWAERVKSARRAQSKVQLEDVNWAREALREPERALRYASSTLNLDTAEGVLRRIADQYGLDGSGWVPRDEEKPLKDYTPPIPLPDLDEIRKTIVLPELPLELPGVAVVLRSYLPEILDPWSPDLSTDAKP